MTLIDLILISNELNSLTHGTIPKCLADHYGVFVTLSLKLPSPSDTIICTRKSHNINTDKFLNDLAQSYILNEHIFTITDIDIVWQTFKNEFLLICNEVAPVRHNRIRKKKNIWFNSEIQSLIYQRDYLHHLATKNRNNLTWSHYKSFRNHVTTKIRLAKKEYYTNEIKLNRQNPSDMWKILKNLLPS